MCRANTSQRQDRTPDNRCRKLLCSHLRSKTRRDDLPGTKRNRGAILSRPSTLIARAIQDCPQIQLQGPFGKKSSQQPRPLVPAPQLPSFHENNGFSEYRENRCPSSSGNTVDSS